MCLIVNVKYKYIYIKKRQKDIKINLKYVREIKFVRIK